MDKKIKVGMDISQVAHFGGVGIYTKNLSSELSKFSDLEMVYFYSSLRQKYKGGNKNVKAYKLPPSLFEILFNKWRNVPIEKFIGSIDIFHSSDWVQPPSESKKITTYHDVIPIKYPNWSTSKVVDVHTRRLKLVEKEIDIIIAVSESTKRDLIEVSNIPEDKIKVIYEGSTGDFKPKLEEEKQMFRKKYNLPDKFSLAIGGIGERRNLKRIKEAAKDYNLVIAGETIPYLDLEELELLYASARVLVYCSLYEGFGIPILDAFLVGCPVITSNISSMPEVGGKAAIYVNPESVMDIKKRLRELFSDNDLRKDIIKKGFEQVKKFSWEKCAKETREIYHQMMK